MLLESLYKIIAVLIHTRPQPLIEGLDRESQCGFRKDRGCVDAVFSVKLAIKKRREHNLETWILFLDLVKVFDRVPRELLWMVLEKFGAPAKLVSLLKSLHSGFQVKFVIDEVSHTLTCTIGVKQGTLGPALFTIYIAAIMITWRKKTNRPLCLFHTKEDFQMTGRRYNAKGTKFSVEVSEYADDTAVLFESRENLVQYSPLLVEHFDFFGMEIHKGDLDQPKKSAKTVVLFR